MLASANSLLELMAALVAARCVHLAQMLATSICSTGCPLGKLFTATAPQALPCAVSCLSKARSTKDNCQCSSSGPPQAYIRSMWWVGKAAHSSVSKSPEKRVTGTSSLANRQKPDVCS